VNLLSWKLNQEHPMAGFAAGMRWSTLWGIGYNTVDGLLSGDDLNTALACAWFGVYVLATQWLARITDLEAESNEWYERAVKIGDSRRPADAA
jgi:hypothetical protein